MPTTFVHPLAHPPAPGAVSASKLENGTNSTIPAAGTKGAFVVHLRRPFHVGRERARTAFATALSRENFFQSLDFVLNRTSVTIWKTP